MAILAKKLHIKGADGVTHDVNLYTTEAEAAGTGAYAHVIVDGITAHFSLGAASDTYVTKGYIKESNGNSFCIREKGLPLYGSSGYNSSGNFTVPNGATAVRVTVAGAGGGSGWREQGEVTIVFNGGNGDKQIATVSVTPGNTYYISVGGGGNGSNSHGNGSNGGASSAFGITAAGGDAGTNSGGSGANAGNGQGGTGARPPTTSKGNNGWVTVEWGGNIGA